ncbi:MAG: MoxR family ATPase [Lachnobacterium sp.]|nr:MoxR family ATPase [Lachnobacterium sp.]MDD6632582.1 MoxR family ATPase [Lachnobacterium sp.]MDY2912169.1 MoxR family ATPase [Agathobacter sp.]
MNIKEAKQEVKNTITAYLKKDDMGSYEIAIERQRPILLMGPPGIGKTAIMEQVAKELGINLVSYTITHHTRQSAIGLPFISQKEYDGREYSVTEYTMSEIIASVYEQIEKSGIHEGILFLDEINCVSETLAPTMLQFLQYKKFGNHKVPDGFVIVTAGNPPEYNKSVRDFDIVTLDRVKRIFIEEDYNAWREYAYKADIHGSIMSYLEIKKKNFYNIVSDVKGKRFVTARGWEDLSQVMKVYEELRIPVTKDFVIQYLQDEEIADDFANYYELYNKYRNIYRIPEILDGTVEVEADSIKDAPFDEKLSFIGLLTDALTQEFKSYVYELESQKQLLEQLKYLREDLKQEKGAAVAILGRLTEAKRRIFERQKELNALDKDEIKAASMTIKRMTELVDFLKTDTTGNAREDFSLVKDRFDTIEFVRKEGISAVQNHLNNAFAFLVKVYGEGQELVIFLTELSAGYYSLRFISECGNEAFYKYNKLLLLKENRSRLTEEAMELIGIS